MNNYMKVFLMALIVFLLIVPNEGQASGTVVDNNNYSVIIDKKETDLDIEVYTIKGQAYYSLVGFAEILNDTTSRFDFQKNSKKNTYTILKNERYSFNKTQCYNCLGKAKKVTMNLRINKKKYKKSGYKIGKEYVLKQNDLAKLLNVKVSENKKKEQLSISTVKKSKAVFNLKSEDFINSSIKKIETPFHPNQINTWLINNKGTTFSVLEKWKKLTVTKYSAKYKKISTKNIKMELPLVGSFYSGEKYNYIAFGRNNLKEKNIEVIRIVKYDKNFKRLNSVSIKGNSIITIKPFHASAGGRFAEAGDKLVFHTSRLRYKSSDNLNHQSQLTIEINTNKMKVTNILEPFQWNHVSHSFDQYVLMDGMNPVYLDLGDAYPRALVLNKESEMKKDEYIYDDENWGIFNINGATGDNFTGTAIGGFEQSKTHYLTAFTSMNQSKLKTKKYGWEYHYYNSEKYKDYQRKIYIYASSKSFQKEQINKVTLMNYEKTKLLASSPTIVKINSNRFIVLWNEFNKKGSFKNVRYVYVNGKGEKVSESYKNVEIQLSTTEPIIKGNKLIGISDLDTKRVAYQIKLK